MKISRRCIVSGQVQGVFFRASTCQKASELGITGWVRNLSDQSVEVLACGKSENIDDLIQWLWQGPDSAIVRDVRVMQAEIEIFSDFAIRHD